MHAAPADFAFRRQPLAIAFGDIAASRNVCAIKLGVADRVLGKIGRAARRIDADDAVVTHAQVAQLAHDPAGLLDHFDKFLAVVRRAEGRAAPDRRDGRTDFQIVLLHLFGKRLDLVIGRIDGGVRVDQKNIDAIKLHAIDLGVDSQRNHRVEINRRLRVRTLADQTRPHGVVKFRKIGLRAHVTTLTDPDISIR